MSCCGSGKRIIIPPTQTMKTGNEYATVTGKSSVVVYGVITGNRYNVVSGQEIEVDMADLETHEPGRPGLLEAGYVER
jgi:hypothetical protein